MSCLYSSDSEIAARSRRVTELVKKRSSTSRPTVSRFDKEQAHKKRVGNRMATIAGALVTGKRLADIHGLRAIALTLTFASVESFSGRAFSDFIRPVRKKVEKHGCQVLPYVWSLNCTKVGLLHIHAVLWLPCSLKIEHAELLHWWGRGSTWIEPAHSLSRWARYIGKDEGVEALPTGSRCYGCSKLDEAGLQEKHRRLLPVWLKKVAPEDASIQRIKGGGLDVETGEVFICPYVFAGNKFVKKTLKACLVSVA